MSIFDKIKNFVTGNPSTDNRTMSVYYPSGAISSPASTGLSKKQKEDIAFQTVKEKTATARKVLAAAGAALLTGGLAAVFPAVASSTVAFAGKQAVTKPIQTAAAALVGVPLVVGVLKEKPSLITSLPGKAYETGKGLINVIEDHPVATALIGGVTGGVAAYEAGKAIFGNEETPEPSAPSITLPKQESETVKSNYEVLNPQEDLIASEGTKKSPSRRRRTTRKQAPTQTQSQKMNVSILNVQNKTAPKNYIKVSN